ncbi:MAG: hypothetical protein ACRDJ4_12020 [Actinomycetota bacterium]
MRWIASGLVCLFVVPVLALAAAGEGDVAPAGQGGNLAAAVLSHPGIRLSTDALRDVEAGDVDARLLQVLIVLASEHDLGAVGPIRTGHSYYVHGTTRVSNHAFARAVDIGAVDGARVSVNNDGAREAVALALSLAAPLRPDEVGSPWLIPTPGLSVFSDADHLGHLHLGWR